MGDDSSADRTGHRELLVRDPTGRLLIGLSIGTYRIESAIGAGGMGLVFRAHDERLQRSVAIKLLAEVVSDEDARSTLLREARFASRLNHPSICTIYEVADVDGLQFIVFEYIDGKPLDALIPADGLPVETVISYGRQIADALVHAHGQGVIHRDLKSANVIATSSGRVKVLDFGLARLVRDQDGMDVSRRETGLETVGAIAGTLPYMAPETLRGETADARTDVWALGVVLYELATGARPFTGRTPFELTSGILREPAPALPARLPVGLRTIIQRCLTKEPGQRYQQAVEIRAALETLESSALAPVPQAASPNRSDLSSFKRRWSIVAAAVLMMALAGAAVLWSRRTQQPRATASQLASVVALPARVLGAPEFQYLTDAVPATLSTQLVKIDGLDTKVPPNSLQVQQLGGDLTRIANAYDASACVVSSITADAERLVLNVQLVEPRNHRVLWSDEYTGARQSYLDLVRQAATGLRGALRPGDLHADGPTHDSETASSEAELEFRRGRYYSSQYNNRHQPSDFDTALASFTRTLRLDPTLTDAAAEIASLYAYRWESSGTAANLSDSSVWARKAVTLNPRAGLGWANLAWSEVRKPDSNMRDVLRYALKAAAYGPRCSQCQFSLILQKSASLTLAVSLEARRLDPLYLYPSIIAGDSLYEMGQGRQGLSYVDDVLRVEPDLPFALWSKALILVDLGRTDEAAPFVRRFETHVAEKRFAEWPYRLQLQHALALTMGDIGEADRLFKRLMSDAQEATAAAAFSADSVIPFLVRHGELDQALQALKLSSAYDYDALRLDPRLEPLRSDARFADVVSRARAEFEDEVALLHEAGARGELPHYLEQPLADLLVKLGMQRE
jgi:eukaryotic-like serine/threonine-protein kinase